MKVIAYTTSVMHDTFVVVGNAIVVDDVSCVLVEVEQNIDLRVNVFEVDCDEAIAIRSRLLVIESYHMTKLVHDCTFL